MFKDTKGKKKLLLLLAIEILAAGLVLVADLLTKEFVYTYAKLNGRVILIKGVLSLIAVENTGASFGIFSDHTIVLSVISLISALVVTGIMVFTAKNRNFFLRFALVLILAGAVGNLVDRFALGYVRDFLNFDFMNFAVFNIADSALTVGTVAMVVYIIFYYKPKPTKKELAAQQKSANQLAESLNQLEENSSQLAENSNQLAENSNQLAESSNKLEEISIQLEKGAIQREIGANQLEKQTHETEDDK